MIITLFKCRFGSSCPLSKAYKINFYIVAEYTLEVLFGEFLCLPFFGKVLLFVDLGLGSFAGFFFFLCKLVASILLLEKSILRCNKSPRKRSTNSQIKRVEKSFI